jgi:hypothetical protein
MTAQDACRRPPSRLACKIPTPILSYAPMHKTMAILTSASGAALAACAMMQSYSSLRVLERPPYYDSYLDLSVPQGTAVGHLPIRVDAAEVLDARGRAVLVPLLDAMNSYLDAAGWSARLDSVPTRTGGAPWAYVGSERRLRERTHLAGDSTKRREVVIQFLGPSERWAARLRAIADSQRVAYVLAISIGPAEYYLHQRGGLSFRKELELGTGYRVPVGWLNDLDEPVQVLHLTGLLLTREGKVVRAGAEGIIAKRPNFFRSVAGIENLLTEADIASVLTSVRRDDLEGQPLAWQVALTNLVSQLLLR